MDRTRVNHGSTVILQSAVHVGHSHLDRADAVGIWLYMMGCGLVGFLSRWVWVRFVSATVSWWLAGFVWVITLWLAFTCRPPEQ